jgi:hypothetical protein
MVCVQGGSAHVIGNVQEDRVQAQGLQRRPLGRYLGMRCSILFSVGTLTYRGCCYLPLRHDGYSRVRYIQYAFLSDDCFGFMTTKLGNPGIEVPSQSHSPLPILEVIACDDFKQFHFTL